MSQQTGLEDTPPVAPRLGGRRSMRRVLLAMLPMINGILLIVQGLLESEPFDVAFPPEIYVVVNGGVIATAAMAKISSLIASHLAALNWVSAADEVRSDNGRDKNMESGQTGESVRNRGDAEPPCVS